jgi:hypothetical protein
MSKIFAVATKGVNRSTQMKMNFRLKFFLIALGYQDLEKVKTVTKKGLPFSVPLFVRVN